MAAPIVAALRTVHSSHNGCHCFSVESTSRSGAQMECWHASPEPAAACRSCCVCSRMESLGPQRSIQRQHPLHTRHSASVGCKPADHAGKARSAAERAQIGGRAESSTHSRTSATAGSGGTASLMVAALRTVHSAHNGCHCYSVGSTSRSGAQKADGMQTCESRGCRCLPRLLRIQPNGVWGHSAAFSGSI